MTAGAAATVQGYLDDVARSALDDSGWCQLPQLLPPEDCARLAALYSDNERFRSTVVMARHGFGAGEYRYFRYPLPPLVQSLREGLYPELAPMANEWHRRLGITARFPAAHRQYLARCHAQGQHRPTPLLLKYGAADYNCLHQDLYGDEWFPLQVAILLSAPGRDFTGGEFVITEQRPRMQSRPHVVPLQQGDAVVFAVNHRPRQGSRGYHRAVLRHGVSTIRTGQRYAAGIIFHDAR